MDHIGHMPTAYLCALDQLGNGDRTASRLAGLIDHYERATGLQSSPELAPVLPGWRDAVHRIAGRRYFETTGTRAHDNYLSFRTIKAAIAYGEKHFGETATRYRR